VDGSPLGTTFNVMTVLKIADVLRWAWSGEASWAHGYGTYIIW